MYPWPVSNLITMDEALDDTAMNYLEHTGQAEEFMEVQHVAAMAIVRLRNLASGIKPSLLTSRSRQSNKILRQLEEKRVNFYGGQRQIHGRAKRCPLWYRRGWRRGDAQNW
jgi:hypothetical protein